VFYPTGDRRGFETTEDDHGAPCMPVLCGYLNYQDPLHPSCWSIAPARIRGLFLCAYSLFWSFGIVSIGVGLYVTHHADPLDWRRICHAQFVFLGLFLPGLVLLPEGPWWLARKGREEQAKKAMRRLYGSVRSINS
jgi:hypothetical protein